MAEDNKLLPTTNLTKRSKEWTSPYNSFNSMKVLLLREHLEGCASGEFLPPITVDTDPTNHCNFNCVWCNAEEFRNKAAKSMTPEHLLRLADFYKEWGVKSTCIAGGGEPLLNKGFTAFVDRLGKNGLESGVITNGSLMTDEHVAVIADNSRWCGVSMDAGTEATYTKLKGLKDPTIFYKVINNIEKLAKARDAKQSKLSVCYKYLIHPDNCLEIYRAVELAKSIGINDFHMRPVGWDNIYATKDRGKLDWSNVMEEAQAQIAASQELETDTFKVYGITHKFGEVWQRKLNFKKCRATPLLATFGADGNCHLCFDMRGREDLILCTHYPDPHEIQRVWGTEHHKKIIDSIRIETCPRCFEANTNVVTNNGIQKIVDIKVGDTVLSSNGNMKFVTRKYESKGNAVKLFYKGSNIPIIASGNHKVHIIEGSKCSYKSKSCICYGRPCSTLKVCEDRCVHPGCHNPSLSYKIVEKEIGNLISTDLLVIQKMKDTVANKYSSMDEDLGWLVGIYLAEGHCSAEKRILRRERCVHFYLSSKEDTLAQKISRIVLEKFGTKNQKVYYRNNSQTITFQNRELREFLLPFGNMSYEKTIPMDVIQGVKESVAHAIIQGYIDGDGHRGEAITALTVSESLVYTLKLLCSKINIFVSISECKKRISKIGNRIIEYKHTPYALKFISQENRKTKTYYLDNEHYFAVPWTKKENMEIPIDLYNLEVEEDHSYTANCVSVSNCTFGPYNEIIEKVIMEDRMYRNFP